MTTELPMFPVPRRPVRAGIALLALWATLSAGFVAATSRLPDAPPIAAERPCVDAERAIVRRLEEERSLVLERDLAAQERGRAYAERQGWMTPGLRSTPPAPSGAAVARVHAVEAARGALCEAKVPGEGPHDGGSFALVH